MNSPPASAALPRRDFIRAMGAAAVGAALVPQFMRGDDAAASEAAIAAPNPRSRYEIAFLEKWFFDGGGGRALKYTYSQMAQTCDEIGLDLELTVRKDGHITPERAPDELPLMAEALAAKQRKILFIALDTVKVDEPYWENAVRTARKLGIKQYRHRGFKYEANRPIRAQIADFNSLAKEFAAANREIGVQALYQTHAGPMMAGGAGWDLDLILDGVDPRYFGVAFDTRHIKVELGQSWPNVVKLLAPRTACLCLKDFVWTGDQPVGVPLGHGNVKKAMVDAVLQAHGGPLPMCIHNEYWKLASVPFDQRANIVQAFRADAQVLYQWLGINSA